MATPEQSACTQIVLSCMPEEVKTSRAIIDIADTSMNHIMGGDVLERLSVMAIRQVVAMVAEANQEQWIQSVKHLHLDTFANSSFNKSPELMLSLFEHCTWAPMEGIKEANLHIKSNNIILEVNRKTFINATTSGYFQIPSWVPFIIRNLCKASINRIDVHFEGETEDADYLAELRTKFFNANRNTDYTSLGNHVLQPAKSNFVYSLMQGTLCFAAHSKRRGGATVFAKFSRRQSQFERQVNDMMKMDFAPIFP